jgi:cytochrome d ubiquinol oxidase subunit I
MIDAVTITIDNPDLLLLARAQFGLNIGFHILFPSLAIALSLMLVYFRIRYAHSGDEAWLATYKLGTKEVLTFASLLLKHDPEGEV